MTYFLSEIVAVRRDIISVQFLYQSLGITDLRQGHNRFDLQLLEGSLEVPWCHALAKAWPRQFLALANLTQAFKFSPLTAAQIGYPFIEWRRSRAKSVNVGLILRQQREISHADKTSKGLGLITPQTAYSMGYKELWWVSEPYAEKRIEPNKVFI
jgi:hypothetical protein